LREPKRFRLAHAKIYPDFFSEILLAFSVTNDNRGLWKSLVVSPLFSRKNAALTGS
jgi:hypothetical protein